MIELPYLRSSMNGTWSMCKMKFMLGYILGWQEPSNKKADKGTMVHKVMEILANAKSARQNNESTFSDDILGTISSENYEIDPIIDTVYKHYSTAFSHHDWTVEDHKEIVKWCWKTLNYNNGEFDPANQNIVKAEQNFKLHLNEEWAKDLELTGTIDLITKVDDKTYEIIDYKTGARTNWATGKAKEYKDFFEDFQLRYYHLAVSMLYPEIENILVTIFYVNSGGPFTVSFGKSDIPETIRRVRELYDEIRLTEKPELRRGFHCKFCDYSKSTFEGTNLPVIHNTGQTNCNFTPRGEAMKKCDQMKFIFDNRSMELVVANATKDGYINKYKAPGETPT
jgi:CRISPR/Cas system-associated exonuclease Cas4 (RecB family)